MNELTSLSLLDRIQDTECNRDWEVFVSIYDPFMRRQLKRTSIADSDMDDLVQETLAALFVALPRFSHNGRPGAFRKWLQVIVVRKASAFLGKRQVMRKATSEIARQSDDFDQSFQEQWDREHDEHLIGCLMDLIRPEFTDTTWLAFERQVVDGLSAAETAGQTGSSVNAVLLSKSRVLRRLREIGRGLVEC